MKKDERYDRYINGMIELIDPKMNDIITDLFEEINNHVNN